MRLTFERAQFLIQRHVPEPDPAREVATGKGLAVWAEAMR